MPNASLFQHAFSSVPGCLGCCQRCKPQGAERVAARLDPQRSAKQGLRRLGGGDSTTAYVPPATISPDNREWWTFRRSGDPALGGGRCLRKAFSCRLPLSSMSLGVRTRRPCPPHSPIARVVSVSD